MCPHIYLINIKIVLGFSVLKRHHTKIKEVADQTDRGSSFRNCYNWKHGMKYQVKQL